jgi:hypothetical protein
MKICKTYVSLDRVISASSGGLSSLEALFNTTTVIINGDDEDFELIKLIEELTFNKDYNKIVELINQIKNG